LATTIDAAIARVSEELGSIGAVQNRLSYAVNNLFSMKENYQTAYSRIVDADIATETANLVRQQVLQQAATAMLAQANQQPALALQLLGD